MFGQILGIAAALGLTYLLLRLRQALDRKRQDKWWPRRAYVTSLGESKRNKNEDGDMEMWPKELEIQTEPLSSRSLAVMKEQQPEKI